MKIRYTPLALLAGFSGAANAATIVQSFNIAPTAGGIDITIGANATAQYTYKTSVKKAGVEDERTVGLLQVNGNSLTTWFPTTTKIVPGAGDGTVKNAYIENTSDTQYLGLIFDINGVKQVGVARFLPNTGTAITLASNAAGVGPILADVEYAVAAVPEPAEWAMLVTGLGAAGAALRRRRRKQALAVAA